MTRKKSNVPPRIAAVTIVERERARDPFVAPYRWDMESALVCAAVRARVILLRGV